MHCDGLLQPLKVITGTSLIRSYEVWTEFFQSTDSLMVPRQRNSNHICGDTLFVIEHIKLA